MTARQMHHAPMCTNVVLPNSPDPVRRQVHMRSTEAEVRLERENGQSAQREVELREEMASLKAQLEGEMGRASTLQEQLQRAQADMQEQAAALAQVAEEKMQKMSEQHNAAEGARAEEQGQHEQELAEILARHQVELAEEQTLREGVEGAFEKMERQWQKAAQERDALHAQVHELEASQAHSSGHSTQDVQIQATLGVDDSVDWYVELQKERENSQDMARTIVQLGREKDARELALKTLEERVIMDAFLVDQASRQRT